MHCTICMSTNNTPASAPSLNFSTFVSSIRPLQQLFLSAMQAHGRTSAKDHIDLGLLVKNDPSLREALSTSQSELKKLLVQLPASGSALFNKGIAGLGIEEGKAVRLFLIAMANATAPNSAGGNQSFLEIARSTDLMKNVVLLIKQIDGVFRGNDAPDLKKQLDIWEGWKTAKPARVFTASLDALANKLESLGLLKLAADVDSVSNSLAGKEVEVRMELAELPKAFLEGVAEEEIIQGFIAKVEDADVRIRQRTVPGQPVEYTLTAKYRPDHDESEITIPQKLFEALWPVTTSKQTKDRFKKDGWDIDAIEEVDGKKDGQVFAEYELSPEQLGGKLVVPSDFRIIGTPTL